MIERFSLRDAILHECQNYLGGGGGLGGREKIDLKQKDASQLIIKDPVLKEVVEHGSNLNYSEKNPVFQSQHVSGITH